MLAQLCEISTSFIVEVAEDHANVANDFSKNEL